jgi:hypothetical protein
MEKRFICIHITNTGVYIKMTARSSPKCQAGFGFFQPEEVNLTGAEETRVTKLFYEISSLSAMNENV